jgi:hypothetical protein
VAGLAILLLLLATFFGFLNTQKTKALRAAVATAQTARDAAERRIHEKLDRSADGTLEKPGQLAEAENRAAKAEAELAQVRKDKADLQTRLDENQKEIARESAPGRTGLRGTVLAVNQAYNFVVLNLSTRHAVESNAEMLVPRDGALIG